MELDSKQYLYLYYYTGVGKKNQTCIVSYMIHVHPKLPRLGGTSWKTKTDFIS